MKKLRYLLEAWLVYLAYGFFRAIGEKRASGLGGWLARRIGPRLGVSKTARKNLRFAMPELSGPEREAIIAEMWENLGRSIGEFSYISNTDSRKFLEKINLAGEEHLYRAREAGKGVILFSGHFANWEILPKVAFSLGMPLMLVYRPANNPWVNWLIYKTRSSIFYKMLPKGSKAAREVSKHLKSGGLAGMLVDQKMNEGISVPFLGRNAMTAPAMAELALRYGAALIPARVVRTQGAHFDVTLYKPLVTEGKTARAIMEEVNELFGAWIREKPEQWFWLHKRWPKEKKT